MDNKILPFVGAVSGGLAQLYVPYVRISYPSDQTGNYNQELWKFCIEPLDHTSDDALSWQRSSSEQWMDSDAQFSGVVGLTLEVGVC